MSGGSAVCAVDSNHAKPRRQSAGASEKNLVRKDQPYRPPRKNKGLVHRLARSPCSLLSDLRLFIGRAQERCMTVRRRMSRS